MTTPKPLNPGKKCKTPPPAKKARRRALRTNLDCRRALAHYICELEAGRLDVGTARVLIYGLVSFSTIHERSVLEVEIEAIKQAMADAGQEVRS